MCLRLWLRGRRSVNRQAKLTETQPMMFLAPAEPNVYRLREQQLSGAPAERNVLADEHVKPCISLRWSEEPKQKESINIRSLWD